MAVSMSRATAAVEATPRFAILGSTNFTNVEVGTDAKIVGSAADKYASVIARWTDSSNYLQAELHLNSADTFLIRQVVAGTPTTLATTTQPPVVSGNWYTIRLVCYATGRAIGQVLDSTGTSVLAQIEASTTVLATGGTLATGKPGFADQSTGTTAATRYYDSFYVATPAAEPIVVYSGRSAEIRSDGAERQDSTGTYYGDIQPYRGARFFLPASGSASRSGRILGKARRNDVDAAADDQIADSTTWTLHYTPRYWGPPR